MSSLETPTTENSGMTFEELEQIVASLATSQARTADTVASIASSVEVLTAGQSQQSVAIDRLIDAQMQTFNRMDAILSRIDQMQSEVRGLQTESRRIWERLEGLSPSDE
jgi:ABC-type transporter Mla subunit MlaD